LWRLAAHPDRPIRDCIRWYYRVGRRVWFHEIRSFFVRDRREEHGPTLAEFWGAPQDAEENALQVPAKRQQENVTLSLKLDAVETSTR
jgi:anaerobic magnesium-protoporphyrin IX monomethyl ester cyclase